MLRRCGVSICGTPAVVDATLKLAGDSCQMSVHRSACRVGVARSDRANDRCMVAQGLLGKFWGVKMVLHPAPQLRALVPQTFHDEMQRAIAGGLGQAQMEIAIALLAQGEIMDVKAHVVDRLAYILDVGVVVLFCGYRCVVDTVCL